MVGWLDGHWSLTLRLRRPLQTSSDTRGATVTDLLFLEKEEKKSAEAPLDLGPSSGGDARRLDGPGSPA